MNKYIKRYESKKYTRLGVVVDVNGKKQRIQFEHGYNMGEYKVYAYYVTRDAEIQKALESCKDFNRDYFLVSTKEINPIDVKLMTDSVKTEETSVKKTRKTKEE